jgi:hypothetical protein
MYYFIYLIDTFILIRRINILDKYQIKLSSKFNLNVQHILYIEINYEIF